ncbi:MAG: DUF2442 domain-containing protein [Eubacteriales bacterium]
MTVNKYPKLLDVKATDDYKLLLHFSSGEKKVYDFKSDLDHPFYKELRNPVLFKNVRVIDGEIEWATGQDFCPHTLYEASVD